MTHVPLIPICAGVGSGWLVGGGGEAVTVISSVGDTGGLPEGESDENIIPSKIIKMSAALPMPTGTLNFLNHPGFSGGV